MKKLLLILGFGLFLINAQAQRDILNRAGRTLGNKVANRSVDKGTDILADKIVEAMFKKLMNGEKIDDSLDTSGGEPSKQSNRKSSIGLGDLMGGAPAEKVDKQYTFDYEIVLKMTADEGSNSIVQLLPSIGGYIAMEISSIKIITDFEENESYTILNDKLTSMNMSKYTENSVLDQQYDPEQAKITITDDYQTIAGYRCRRITSETEEGNSDIWMTEDFIKNPYLTASQRAELGDNFYGNGYPMLITFEDEKGKKSSLEVVDVVKKEIVMDLSKY